MSRKGMQQRCWEHDYCSPSFYMITVVTEPRRECLGVLNSVAGAATDTVPGSVPVAAPGLGSVPVAAPGLGSVPVAAPASGSPAPAAGFISLSPTGKAVRDVWQRTSFIYKEVEACECVVMPDHFHGILWVKERLKRPVGHIIKAFKRVSEQEGLGDSLAGAATETEPKAGVAPGSVLAAAPAAPGSVLAAAPGSVLAAAPAAPGSVLAAAPAAKLWQKGFQDSILLRRGQLKSMAKYIADNPRRLAEKRANPELFTVVTPSSVNPAPGAGAGTVPGSVPVAAPASGSPAPGSVPVAAPASGFPIPMIGNRYLLEHPLKQQVQISRSISAAELAAKKEELLYLAKHGSVLVSPCISPGEKEIAHAALDEGYPLIVLLENGFPPIYKPPGRYFDTCAAGKLLMLAPFPYHRRKQTITREQCLILNDWSHTIASC